MRWIQENCRVIGLKPPKILQNAIPRSAKYFTLITTPKSLKLAQCFRLRMPSEMGRDALFVDVPLCPSSYASTAQRSDVLRLCTTHLESLEEGAQLRQRQLEMISQYLREDTDHSNIVAGLVGGDMNAICDSDHDMHRQSCLEDAWEEMSFEYHTTSEYEQLDLSFGHLDGHTWGYQSHEPKWSPARLDKFMLGP